jgi:hypothetical protein
VVLIVVYSMSAFLWVPRIIGLPTSFGTWAGFAELYSLAAAGIALYASGSRGVDARAGLLSTFAIRSVGVCAIAFGAAHFVAVKETAAMVPAWLPFGGTVWSIATGLGHLLAGIAIVTGVQAILAARLLTAMCVSFGTLVWLPMLFASTVPHMTWAGTAITMALAGAAWVIADELSRQRPRSHPHGIDPSAEPEAA